MKALWQNILIKEVKEEIKTESGMILSAEEVKALRYKKGVVVLPSKDVTCVKKGDYIYYDAVAGYTMYVDGKAVTVISERDVNIVL